MVVFSHMKMPLACLFLGTTCRAMMHADSDSNPKSVRALSKAESSDISKLGLENIDTNNAMMSTEEGTFKHEASDGMANMTKGAVSKIEKTRAAANNEPQDPVSCGSFQKVWKKIAEYETFSFVGGATATTAGTIWALNRLSEAMDDFRGTDDIPGEVDAIGFGYGFLFTLLLTLGPVLLVNVIFHKFAPHESSWKHYLILGMTGVAGLTCGMGVCYQSAQSEVGMIACYAIAASAVVAVFILWFLVVKNKRENAKIGVVVVSLHALGFMSFVGGLGWLSYNATEEIADAAGDSLGGETYFLWAIMTFGFTWLIKAFMSPNGGRDNFGSLGTAGVVGFSFAAAGLFAAGFHFAILGNLGAIGCFGGFAVIAVFIVLAKFSNCHSGLTKFGEWLGLRKN